MKTIAIVCGALAVLGIVSGGCGSSDPISGTGGVGTGGVASGGAPAGGAPASGGTSAGGAIGTGGTGTGGALGGFGGMGGDTGGTATGGAATGGAPARPACDEIPSLVQGQAGLWDILVDGFGNCQPIPAVHTCEGEAFRSGTSPAITWDDPPAGTQSFALVFKDLTILATTDPGEYELYGRGYHWAIWDLPAATRDLDAALGEGHEVPGINNARQWATFEYSYFGPCPNPIPELGTDVTDSYSFVLYALPTLPPALIPPAVNSIHPDTDEPYGPVRAMDDYFKSIAIAAIEYRGTSDAHADVFAPTGETVPPCSAGVPPAECVAITP